MKILIFSDPHYCTKEGFTGSDRKPRLSLEKMKALVERAKNDGVGLIVCLGDFINIESPSVDRENLEKASEIFRSSGIKCVCCMGNHDGEVFTREEFAFITGFELAPCHIDLPSGKRLVFVDANYDSSYSPYRVRNVDWTDSNIPPEELVYLEKLLENKDSAVFIHQNVYPDSEIHHRVKNYDSFLEIISRHNVTDVFQGHYHYGNESVYNGIKMHTLKAMCVFDETEIEAEF